MQGFTRRCSLRACLQTGMDTTQRTSRESPSRWSLSVSSFSLSSYVLETETRMDRLQVPAGPVVRVPDCIQATGSLLFQKMSSFWLRMSDVCGRQTGAWDPEPPNYLSSAHGSQVTSVEASCKSELGRCWLSRFPTLLKPEKKYPHVLFYCLIDLYFFIMVLGTKYWALHMLGK